MFLSCFYLFKHVQKLSGLLFYKRSLFVSILFLQMGNASEIFLFVSRISKNNDFIMGTLYTIFGKLTCFHLWNLWCEIQPLVSPLPLRRSGVLSVLGNGILLFVAYRKKSSLKPAELFVVNLAISDLSMTMTLFPLAIPSAFAHKWVTFDHLSVCLCYLFHPKTV